MSKRNTGIETERFSSTTEKALVLLAEQIAGFVSSGALDSRFASKLAKRLGKEAEIVAAGKHSTSSGRKSVKETLDALDAALRNADAKLLVTANAALRAANVP